MQVSHVQQRFTGVSNDFCVPRANIESYREFLALLDCQQSYCDGVWRRRPSSVNSGFSGAAQWTQAKFCGQLPIQHISRPLFMFSKFSIFKFLRFFFRFR